MKNGGKNKSVAFIILVSIVTISMLVISILAVYYKAHINALFCMTIF